MNRCWLGRRRHRGRVFPFFAARAPHPRRGQEAINNALKHSQADEVHIATGGSEGRFTLTIRDSGIGFDPAAPGLSERNGLSNMRSRVAGMSGRVEIHSQPAQGTTIAIYIPLAPLSEKPLSAPTL